MDIAIRRAEFLEAAKAHYAADMLIKGTYSDTEAETFKGCSVGCFLHNVYPKKTKLQIANLDNKHAKVAKHYGYPEWLAFLQDTIFEGLPNGDSAKWHVQLAEAISDLPADYDWQTALHRVHIALLRVSYQNAGSAKAAVQTVMDLHERAAAGQDVSSELWSAAESAAWSAAWNAAESAAWSAAWSAAESAAESAAWNAAESAAWNAAWSAAWSAAESVAESVAESAAWNAAESAAWNAAESAAYQEMRDGILAALVPVAA